MTPTDQQARTTHAEGGLRAGGPLLGFVRRIDEPQGDRGHRWQVYDRDGSEVAVSDQRLTAANYLRREAERSGLIEETR